MPEIAANAKPHAKPTVISYKCRLHPLGAVPHNGNPVIRILIARRSRTASAVTYVTCLNVLCICMEGKKNEIDLLIAFVFRDICVPWWGLEKPQNNE